MKRTTKTWRQSHDATERKILLSGKGPLWKVVALTKYYAGPKPKAPSPTKRRHAREAASKAQAELTKNHKGNQWRKAKGKFGSQATDVTGRPGD